MRQLRTCWFVSGSADVAGEKDMEKSNLFCALALVVTGLMGGCQAVTHQWGMSRSAVSTRQPHVSRVDLFPNGVGYIGYQADVDNNQTLHLSVHPNQVNDLLKTIVFFDSAKRPPEVKFSTPIPLSVKLASLPLAPGINGAWISLLSQLKGHRVKLEFKHATCVSGRLMEISRRWPILPAGRPEIPRPTTKGQPAVFLWPPRFAEIYHNGRVRRVSLATLVSFKVANRHLRASLRQAMRYIAANHQARAVSVAIRFRGKGRRMVEFGYATQVPLWRMTYRLLLPATHAARAKAPTVRLLADAIIHNTTNTPWQGITLHINGSWPHSFLEDLLHPLYGRRPVIPNPPDTSFTPQHGLFHLPTATADLALSNNRELKSTLVVRGVPELAIRKLMPQMAIAYASKHAVAAAPINVQAMAAPQRSNPAFNYVARDVSISSEHSASFPILSSSISGRVVSIVDVNDCKNHLRRGVLLFNNSGRYLPSGPMTVYECGNYIGEVNAAAITVNSRQVLPFATDLALKAKIRRTESRAFDGAHFSRGELLLNYAITSRVDIKLHNLHRHQVDVIADFGPAVGWRLAATPYHILNLVSGVAVAIPAAAMTDKTYHVNQLSSQTTSVNLYTVTPEHLSTIAQMKGMAASMITHLKQTDILKNRFMVASRAVSDMASHIASLNASENRIRQNLAAAQAAPRQAQLFAEELIALDKKLAASQQALLEAQRHDREARHALDTYIQNLK